MASLKVQISMAKGKPEKNIRNTSRTTSRTNSHTEIRVKKHDCLTSEEKRIAPKEVRLPLRPQGQSKAPTMTSTMRSKPITTPKQYAHFEDKSALKNYPQVTYKGNAYKKPIPTPRRGAIEETVLFPEYEYLQFTLRITEDIIRNNLYSDIEKKRVFNSHVEANRGRLDMEKMLNYIDMLCEELKTPTPTQNDKVADPCECDDKNNSNENLKHEDHLVEPELEVVSCTDTKNELIEHVIKRHTPILTKEFIGLSDTQVQDVIIGLLNVDDSVQCPSNASVINSVRDADSTASTITPKHSNQNGNVCRCPITSNIEVKEGPQTAPLIIDDQEHKTIDLKKSGMATYENHVPTKDIAKKNDTSNNDENVTNVEINRISNRRETLNETKRHLNIATASEENIEMPTKDDNVNDRYTALGNITSYNNFQPDLDNYVTTYSSAFTSEALKLLNQYEHRDLASDFSTLQINSTHQNFCPTAFFPTVSTQTSNHSYKSSDIVEDDFSEGEIESLEHLLDPDDM